MRFHSDTYERAMRRFGLPGLVAKVPHTAGCIAGIAILAILDVLAAIGPSYRPTAKSTFTPYLGHSFNLLRMTFDPRPQAIFASFTDGLRLLCAL